MGETFCLIKPEAFDRREDIEKDIRENDFSIVKKRKLHWKLNQIRGTYPKENLNYHSKRANLIMSFSIPYVYYRLYRLNPWVEAMMLSSDGDTIRDFVKLCGPRDTIEYAKKEFKNTLRGKYGLEPEHSFIRTIGGKECRFDFNGFHRSSKEEELRRDKKIYF